MFVYGLLSLVERKSVRTAGFCIAAVFVFCFLAPSDARAGYNYSDAWAEGPTSGSPIMIEQGEPWPGPTIVGCGVTQNDYGTTWHTTGASTTITSPNGRTSYNSAYTNSSYACAETSLLFAGTDCGDYMVTSSHMGCCALRGCCSNSPGTSASVSIGISHLKMRFNTTYPLPGGGVGYEYVKVDPCEVTCNNMLRSQSLRYRGQCVDMQIPFGPLGCFIFVKIKDNSTCVCYDEHFN